MKKMILPLLVVALSTPAMADWVLVFNYSDADVYANPASVERCEPA